MEIENKWASKGVGAAGLTTGIIGTAGFGLQLLNGLLNGAAGANNRNCDRPAPAAAPVAVSMCNEIMPVTRYDAEKDAKIAALETEVKLRDANTFTDNKFNELRNYVDGRFNAVNDKLCAQAVHNATNDAVLGCIQGQVNTLLALTKTVIPAANVCPAPMPQYNSWTAPTATT